MSTFLSYLTVLALATLLLAPALYGLARDRRIDRRLREAADGRSGRTLRTAPQKSSSRSTVPSTATW
ncbi:hypothetical protein ACGFYU_25880 [Streptomyces sp. NPDC048337]|uniref:hypothetical protein n=1 Tax=Streptomyces sp. NPDC048337 TaxID=3365535 RepID=UPI003717203F